MKHNFIKILLLSASLAVMSGCATMQSGQTGSGFNMCTVAGAVVSGGGAAAITMAAGPIGAAAFVGALLGTLACTEEDAQPVAAAPAPMPAPAPVAAAPVAELDSDGDGIIDRLDRCPDTARGKKVDMYGCPDILLTLNGINFKFDSYVIEPESEGILNSAVDELNKANSVDVRVVGHTDSTGSDAYNMSLSQKRANAVKDYLVRRGITNSRLTTDGRGEGQPVATNTTSQGRYQNRRVEFHVDGANMSSSSSETPVARVSQVTSVNTTTESWRQLDQTVVNF